MIGKRFEELRYCGSLPSPAGLGLAVLQSTRRPDMPIEELTRILQLDPALTGRLLRLANANQSAATAPACTVHAAAKRLDPEQVRQAALGFTLFNPERFGACKQFDHEAYWSHALATALAARAIAEDEGQVDPGHAYTCGLLSQVGMLALATIHAESYDQVLTNAHGKPIECLLAEEQRQFDIHHWEVAAAIFADWGLPPALVDAVLGLGHSRRDADLIDPRSEPMTSCLCRAALVAERLLLTIEPRRGFGPDWVGLLAPVRAESLDREQLPDYCARVAVPWRKWCERLRLPIGRADPEAARSGEMTVAGVPAHRAAGGPAGSGRGQLRSNLRVLVADDDAVQLRIVREQLATAGYSVQTAGDGEEALRLARANPPQILITDWLMPCLDGIDLVRALRQTKAGRGIYTLLLTACAGDEHLVSAFDAGVDDFLTKPFEPRTLLARVRAGHRMIELQQHAADDHDARMAQVAEMGILTRKLQAAAVMDVLTGLPNRRFAMERMEIEWADAVRLDRPISLLVIDIDHFKRVNDVHGHDTGDRVLHSTATVLRSVARRSDFVCRLGGEEFLVIAPGTDERGARECASRLRRAVESNVLRDLGRDCRVTVSIGAASRSRVIGSADELLKAADNAVFAAKAAGRNTVRFDRCDLPRSA